MSYGDDYNPDAYDPRIDAVERAAESQMSQMERSYDRERERTEKAHAAEVAALRAEVERLRTAIGDIGITNSLGYEGRISITAAHGSIAALVGSALEVVRG